MVFDSVETKLHILKYPFKIGDFAPVFQRLWSYDLMALYKYVYYYYYYYYYYAQSRRRKYWSYYYEAIIIIIILSDISLLNWFDVGVDIMFCIGRPSWAT